MTLGEDYDPLSKEVKQDQHRWFARLRGECPVHHHTMPESELKRQSENYIVASPTAEFWSVFGYKDVQQILHDAGGFSHLEGPGPDRMAQLSPDGMLLTADDPAHRRQRRIASKAFLPRTVARRVPVIQRTVDELIDGFVDRGRCDLMRDFAFPLTVTMLIDFMGVGQDRKDDITRWGAAAIAILGGDEQQLAAGTQATIEFFAFMQQCIDNRRTALAAGEDVGPEVGDDVLTAMITAYDEETDTRFSDVEILQAMHQFYTAGYETTATAIGNGIYRLCTNPGERAKLQADWSLIDTACEEILRYDSPVEGTFRTATCPQLISGVELPAGAKTRIVFASANRDGVAFDRPDEFRVDRPIKELRGHLAFGAGPHTCLGSALGRAEIRYAIEGLLTRLPDLDLDPSAPPTRSTALTVCGFTDMPIVWDPANASSRLS